MAFMQQAFPVSTYDTRAEGVQIPFDMAERRFAKGQVSVLFAIDSPLSAVGASEATRRWVYAAFSAAWVS